MEEQATQGSSFRGWAVIEIFGHTLAAGFVTSEYFGSACLFRIDTPELPEREFVLKEPAYVGGRWTPAGATVQRQASPPRSKLIGPNSIFSLNPCDEDVARAAIEEIYPRPLILLKMPEQAQLAAPVEVETFIDPVCGENAAADGPRCEFENKMYLFCSKDCMRAFQERPEDYVDQTPEPAI